MTAVIEDVRGTNIVRVLYGPWDGQNRLKSDLLGHHPHGWRYVPTTDETDAGLQIWRGIEVEEPIPVQLDPIEALTDEERDAKWKTYHRLRRAFEYKIEPCLCGKAEFLAFLRFEKHLATNQVAARFAEKQQYVYCELAKLKAIRAYESQAFRGARQLQWLLLSIQVQG